MCLKAEQATNTEEEKNKSGDKNEIVKLTAHTNRKDVFCSFPVHWDLHEMNNMNRWENSDF